MNRTMDMTREPNATVPVWYLKKKESKIISFSVSVQFLFIVIKRCIHTTTYVIAMKNERLRTKKGTSDLWNVQYHVANVAARINCAMPDIKNRDQMTPKTLYTCSHLM